MKSRSKQRTLAMMTGFERYTKKTRRAIFLEEMEQVVPWARLRALIEPHYRKAGNGRRPVGLERMLRIYFLQQWFNLADPAVEEALYDSATLRQFAGIDLGAEPVPDETTVCKFRQLLEEHNLGEEIVGTVNLHLQAKGVRITTGTIVDATIIHAPSSTKNRDQSRDPEMHQARKGKQWYFGMKAHVVRSSHKTCLRNILQNRFADLSFCESGVSYSVTTVTLATAFAAGFSSLVANMIKAHMAWCCIDSISAYVPAVALLNRPSYSSALSTFNDGFERLRLSYVDSRFRRFDGHRGRVLVDTLP